MDITILLAQLWGPAIFAVGLGIFISRTYYAKIYRDLEKDVLAVLLFGIIAMMTGIAQILFHNAWNTLPEIIISILGWGTFIKGTLFVVVPRFVDKMGDAWAKKKLIPLAGILMLVVGAYLIYIAYLA